MCSFEKRRRFHLFCFSSASENRLRSSSSHSSRSSGGSGSRRGHRRRGREQHGSHDPVRRPRGVRQRRRGDEVVAPVVAVVAVDVPRQSRRRSCSGGGGSGPRLRVPAQPVQGVPDREPEPAVALSRAALAGRRVAAQGQAAHVSDQLPLDVVERRGRRRSRRGRVVPHVVGACVGVCRCRCCRCCLFRRSGDARALRGRGPLERGGGGNRGGGVGRRGRPRGGGRRRSAAVAKGKGFFFACSHPRRRELPLPAGPRPGAGSRAGARGLAGRLAEGTRRRGSGGSGRRRSSSSSRKSQTRGGGRLDPQGITRRFRAVAVVHGASAAKDLHGGRREGRRAVKGVVVVVVLFFCCCLERRERENKKGGRQPQKCFRRRRNCLSCPAGMRNAPPPPETFSTPKLGDLSSSPVPKMREATEIDLETPSEGRGGAIVQKG